MKNQTTIKTIHGTQVELTDGTRWKVTDISGPVELPTWLPVDRIEYDDFGLDSHLTNIRRSVSLKADLLR